MASRRKTPKLVATPSKPAALVYHLQDFTAARHAVAAFALPPPYGEAPYFAYDEEHDARSTLYDALPEPAVPKDIQKRGFALADATLELVTEADEALIGAGPWSRGFHASASFEEVVARFEADGFRVVTVAELAARAARPRPVEGSRARLRRATQALAKAFDPATVAHLAAWLEEGGPAPGVSMELAALTASLLLDEEIETWGPIEERVFELAARRHMLAGLAETPGDEPIGIDRFRLFSERLERAGWTADEITDAWLDGLAGDRDWTSMRWFAMALSPQIEGLVRRILGRAHEVDPAPALERLLAEAIEELPAELDPIYKASVRGFLKTSDVARELGPGVWARLATCDEKAFGAAARKAKPLPPPAPRGASSPRLAEVNARYGFALPEEVLAVWDLASSLSPEDPSVAFAELDDLGLSLVGPFDLLAGRTRTKPGLDIRLHYRWRLDPPELFTVLVGNVDRLHFGYWLDDPAEGPACVASYYVNDAYEMHVPGRTLWEAIRGALESTWAGVLENVKDDPKNERTYVASLASLAKLRGRIMAYATGERREIGEAYGQKYDLRGLRARHAIAATPEGMGVVAPASQLRPLSIGADELPRALAKKRTAKALVREALGLAEGGSPASALWLGRHCWARGLDKEAYALLDAAYAGLCRPLLREVLALHRAHRDLASVDVLAE